MGAFLAIKEENKGTVVGYNNCPLPLGKRGQYDPATGLYTPRADGKPCDLDKLAEMALRNPKGIGSLFANMPTTEDVQQAKQVIFLNKPIAVKAIEPQQAPVIENAKADPEAPKGTN